MPLFCAEWLPASAFARSASADRPNLGGGWLAGRSPLASAPSRLVASQAALAERSEQVTERLVAEEVETLVCDLEPILLGVTHAAAAAGFAALTLGLAIRLAAQVSLRLKLLDDLLDQLIELLLRQHAAVEDRFHDRVVQRLPRVPGLAIILVRQSVRIIEAAAEKQIR